MAVSVAVMLPEGDHGEGHDDEDDERDESRDNQRLGKAVLVARPIPSSIGVGWLARTLTAENVVPMATG